ncbi:MAG: hypothetical protein Kow00127_05120 [Bacteroidales bacterium]
MSRLFTLLIAITTGLAANVAQSQHFIFEPGAVYEKTVPATGYSTHIVYMKNLTGGELILGWERLEFDFPEEWQADLCDYVSCYMGIPESGTMYPLTDTIRGYLKITINPNGFAGTGFVSFKVFDNKHPEVADTVSFTIHTVVQTLAASQEEVSFSAGPVPAGTWMNIHTGSSLPVTVQITSPEGEILSTFRQALSGRVYTGNLKPGWYVLSATYPNGKVITRKILKK